MGFLDREKKLRESQLAAEQAERVRQEQLRVGLEIELAQIRQEAERTKAENRAHAPGDNAKISELLDYLPGFNIPEYLELVKKHSGYTGSVCLYTRDDALGLADQELKDRLLKLGILKADGYYPTPTHHPNEKFWKEDINPGNRDLEEPGIGIRFRKVEDPRQIRRELVKMGDWGPIYRITYEQNTRLAFARLIAPAVVFTVGRGKLTPVTSFETFDNSIERCLTDYHIIRNLYFSDDTSLNSPGWG